MTRRYRVKLIIEIDADNEVEADRVAESLEACLPPNGRLGLLTVCEVTR